MHVLGIGTGVLKDMNRLITVALASLMVGCAFAQGTFTIRRPADGSKVREVVKVRIPKNSIQEGEYIGILVNGKFLEAVVPDLEGNDYVYNLDTKARKLPDGKLTIEAVLYFYAQGAPQVRNRSSVSVVLDNSAGIQGQNPEGFLMRYKFYPGKEYSYRRTDESTVSIVSQAQAQLGSRAAEIVLGQRTVRYLIAHQNNYGNEGLIRLQALPEKGKDHAYLVTVGNPTPTKFMDFEMHPIFMRITNTGREVFTSLPIYFPWEGDSTDARTDLFALFPPPVLPATRKDVGDSWEAAIPFGNIDLENRQTTEHMVENLSGRATLESVEWEQGFPCAKIRSELSLGANDLKNIKNIEGVQGDAQSLKIESIQWFALDRGIMIREETRFTSEVLVEIGAGGAGGAAAPGGTGGGRRGPVGTGGAGGSGNPGGITPPGGGNRNSPGIFLTNNFFDLIGDGPLGLYGQRGGGDQDPGGDNGGRFGTSGAGTPGSLPGGQEGFGGGRGGGSTGGPPVKMIMRQTSRWTTVLEQ